MEKFSPIVTYNSNPRARKKHRLLNLLEMATLSVSPDEFGYVSTLRSFDTGFVIRRLDSGSNPDEIRSTPPPPEPTP